MGLNKKGIRLLADDLVARQKMYDQSTEGGIEACGTVCCMAGLCYVRKVGLRAFSRMVKNGVIGMNVHRYSEKLLGLPVPEYGFSNIFGYVCAWPADLRKEYESDGPRWRVIAALKALQRLLPDGSIDPDPNAVHTKLSQLTKMLKEKKKAK